ncbi:MAG: hypothetical protein U0Q15_07510 [Kineosporiaceae bacterium]
MLSTRTRRIIGIIALVFVLYAIYNNPDKSAEVVRRVWEIVLEGIQQIFRFFDRIIGA